MIGGRVEVGIEGDRVVVRVSGRATHRVSQPLRDFANQMIQAGYRNFELDLETCQLFDSTFAGVLAGISLKVSELGGEVVLERVPPRCQESLSQLGIDRLFAVAPENGHPTAERRPLQSLPLSAGSLESWSATVIEAHRLLIQADSRNEPRFRELLDQLSQDVTSQATTPRPEPTPKESRWKQ